ncbi:MAG: molecular chaperone TorD family protein [Actinobacteria bacterium]|nr:molecular chaperone TorD family protein [Actinomycetota bacterium]
MLCEKPGHLHERIALLLGVGAPLDVESYTQLFVLQCHPYASVYLGPEGMLGGEGTDQVAGFYRAIGLVPPAEADHLAALFGLYAALADAEATSAGTDAAAARAARESLLQEHLLSWVPVFLDALRLSADALHAEAYVQWADLVDQALACEKARSAAGTTLPRALRVAPGFPEGNDGLDELVSAVLSPLRSGMVLSRLDLARAGQETGAAGRVGERRFALTSMLREAPVEMLSWLATQAANWEHRHLSRARPQDAVAQWWAKRAASSSFRLSQSAQSAARQLAET